MSIFPPVPKRNLQLLPQVPLCYLTMITGTGDSWATLLLTLPGGIPPRLTDRVYR